MKLNTVIELTENKDNIAFTMGLHLAARADETEDGWALTVWPSCSGWTSEEYLFETKEAAIEEAFRLLGIPTSERNKWEFQKFIQNEA